MSDCLSELSRNETSIAVVEITGPGRNFTNAGLMELKDLFGVVSSPCSFD